MDEGSLRLVICQLSDPKLSRVDLFLLFLMMQIRRNMAKLELYRKFTNSLVVSVLLSIAWIGFEVFFFFFAGVISYNAFFIVEHKSLLVIGSLSPPYPPFPNLAE